MRLQTMAETAAKQAKILDDEHRLTTILAVLNSNRERLMVLLSLKAGLRAVEIASLTWGCIRESDTVIELLRTKGGKARSVPINKDLKKALREYRDDCERTNDRGPAVPDAPQRSHGTAVGQRRGAMVSGSLHPAPRLGRLLLALRPPQLWHPGRPQCGEGRRIAARCSGYVWGMPVSQHDAPIRLRRLPKSLNYALHNPIAVKECAMSLILWLSILVGNAAAIVVLSNMTAEGTSAMGGRS